MIYLISDYCEGATAEIMTALAETNAEQTVGYGLDKHCDNARELIKAEIGKQDADVHFFVGGTQTNLTAISAFLRPHQAVIAPLDGHVCVHETGAIEATGHKVIAVRATDCKLSPKTIEEQVLFHEDEHFVIPKMVYISNATELGTVYTKAELRGLRAVCDKYGLYLYIDGARLATALRSNKNDMTMAELADFADAFYIGGTKNGALFGEALVILNPDLKADFRWIIKQKGGMLAKGRLLGVQFETFFKDDLYYRLAEQANKMAEKLRKGISAKGYTFYLESDANMIFPVFSNQLMEQLEQKVYFYKICAVDADHSCIRLVTSWATTEKMVDEFLELL